MPFSFLFYLWPGPDGSTLDPGALLGPIYLGPTFAMTQSLVRPDTRALASRSCSSSSI
jgi:hypothetical protein